jgi:hypothetical protein
MDASATESASWTLAFRKEMEGRADRVCRVHLILAGQSGAMGGALAMTLGWKDAAGHAFRCGMGQAFGSVDAPLRYVTGWDGRPAEPFGRLNFKGYFRWRSPDGTWRLGVQFRWQEGTVSEEHNAVQHGIHAMRVEFRPKWSSLRRG